MTTETTDPGPTTAPVLAPSRVDTAGAPDGWRGPQTSASRILSPAPTDPTPPAQASSSPHAFPPCIEAWLTHLLTACTVHPWTQK